LKKIDDIFFNYTVKKYIIMEKNIIKLTANKKDQTNKDVEKQPAAKLIEAARQVDLMEKIEFVRTEDRLFTNLCEANKLMCDAEIQFAEVEAQVIIKGKNRDISDVFKIKQALINKSKAKLKKRICKIEYKRFSRDFDIFRLKNNK
jgi:hypothetical protein